MDYLKNDKMLEIYDILYYGYPLRVDGFDDFSSEYSEYIDENYDYKNKLIETCETLLNGNSDVILPLSGGLDSRLVLGCLLEILPNKNIHAFNYGLPNQLDFDIPPLIAKKTGIKFQQVSYSELHISPDDCAYNTESIQNIEAFNLLGFTLTKKASQKALHELNVDSKLQIWSGFLGDRVFSGKWSEYNNDLMESCRIYSNYYALNCFKNIIPESYRPSERLYSIYRDLEKPEHLNWLEYMDLHQRQFRVQTSLKTLPNPYRFLFAQENILSLFYSVDKKYRRNGGLQRKYLLSNHKELCNIPVTSRFGYPLRPTRFQEITDKYKRLSGEKIDNIFNTRIQKFKREKLTTERFNKYVPGYHHTLTYGHQESNNLFKKLGLIDDRVKLDNLGKTNSELYSSLGYLLK